MLRVSTLALLAAVLVASASARTLWHQLDEYSFEDYKREFSKRYAHTQEEAMRRSVFEKNLASIRRHNADTSRTWKEGVNHMTDWTEAEFKQLLGYDKSYGFSMHKPALTKSDIDVSSLPVEVDWRSHGVVTAVKDQGRCGSCWSFGSATTLESQVAIRTGYLQVLSEQNILDCTPNPQHCGGTGGCQGGTAELAYDAFKKNGGVQTEWTYPYTSYFGNNSQCKFDKSMSVINVTGYVKLPSNQYEPLMEAIANIGPISISVEASHWQHYESGVFDGCNKTNPDIDHNVQVVGYGLDTETKTPYWLVRNSWSPHWGDHGYIRLKRAASASTVECGMDITPADGSGCSGGPDKVQVCGSCGILFDTVYPLIDV
jgi:cathepsin L